MNRLTVSIIGSAIFLVISLLMAGVITYNSYVASNDMHFIDLAGKQRFLTVELVEEIMLDHLNQTGPQHDHMKTPKIANLISELRANLILLQPAMTTKNMIEALNGVVACFNDYFLPTMLMTKSDLEKDIHKLHEAGEKLVEELDTMVASMVDEQASNRKSSIFHITAFWLLSLTFGVIMGVLIYIERKKYERKLLDALDGATGFQRKIEEQYHDLRVAAEKERANAAKSQDFATLGADWQWELDCELRFSTMSKGVNELGRSAADFIGILYSELNLFDENSNLELRKELEHQKNREEYINLIRPSTVNDTRWLEISGKPIYDEYGNFVGYRGVTRDVTSRIETERALEENLQDLVIANNEVIAANRAKSEFLANMSHELRTPLNAILGFSEMMLLGMGDKLNEKYNAYVQDIHNSGRHLLDVINDILDLAKIEAGKTEVYPEKLSICSVFADCIRLICERAQEKQINIEVKTSCDGLFVYADPVRLKQIILNLLSNSVKFTDTSGKIDVSCIVGDSVIITIEDDGMGMDETGLKCALTKFGQVSNGLDREHEGTGLGLPLSVELAQLMDGTIDVVSELGTGTTVIVTLPIAQ